VTERAIAKKTEIVSKITFLMYALSPLLENPKRCFASFEDPGCGAPP